MTDTAQIILELMVGGFMIMQVMINAQQGKINKLLNKRIQALENDGWQ